MCHISLESWEYALFNDMATLKNLSSRKGAVPSVECDTNVKSAHL